MFTDFEFDGERGSDYGLIVGSFDGGNGTETLSSGADIALHQAKPSRSDKFNLYGADYQSPFTYSFQAIKNPCASKGGIATLSPQELSSIQKWLCRKNGYKKFKINEDSYEALYWMASFSTRQVMLNGKTVGLELTLTADSPYAYAEPVSLTFDCKKNEPFTIYDSSDEEGYLHPDMEITCLEESQSPYPFTLSNSQDNKIMQIDGCSRGEIITIDGKNLIIETSKPSHTLARDFNYFFPRIANTYQNSENTFTPNIDCSITFTYSPIRKVGLP